MSACYEGSRPIKLGDIVSYVLCCRRDDYAIVVELCDEPLDERKRSTRVVFIDDGEMMWMKSDWLELIVGV